jgi:hypothetical protein
MGITSKPLKVKLSNPRNRKQDLPILIEAMVATPPFSIDTALSTCKRGMGLAPRSTCFFSLTYTASAPGKQTGSFTITDNSETAHQATVKLNGQAKPQGNSSRLLNVAKYPRQGAFQRWIDPGKPAAFFGLRFI